MQRQAGHDFELVLEAKARFVAVGLADLAHGGGCGHGAVEETLPPWRGLVAGFVRTHARAPELRLRPGQDNVRRAAAFPQRVEEQEVRARRRARHADADALRCQCPRNRLTHGRYGGRREARRLAGSVRQVAAEDDELQRRERGLEERALSPERLREEPRPEAHIGEPGHVGTRQVCQRAVAGGGGVRVAAHDLGLGAQGDGAEVGPAVVFQRANSLQDHPGPFVGPGAQGSFGFADRERHRRHARERRESCGVGGEGAFVEPKGLRGRLGARGAGGVAGFLAQDVAELEQEVGLQPAVQAGTEVGSDAGFEFVAGTEGVAEPGQGGGVVHPDAYEREPVLVAEVVPPPQGLPRAVADEQELFLVQRAAGEARH